MPGIATGPESRELCYNLAMSTKRMKRWVVYEHRDKEFVFLSRLFDTKAQADKERQKLTGRFYRKASLGVAVVER